MNNQISESIFDDGKVIIPLAEVSHIERPQRNNKTGAINIIFKHSRWADDARGFEPNVSMQSGEDFLKAWCFYRHEVDGVNLSEEGGIVEKMKEIWK